VLRATLAFVVLVVLGVLAAEARRRLLGRGRCDTGLEAFLVVAAGAGLGNAGLGLFPPRPLLTLEPVVLFGLAWAGLLVGLQLDLGVISRLRPWHRAAGFGIPAAAGLAVAACGAALPGIGRGGILLGAAAAVSAPGVMDRLARATPPVDRAAMRLVRLVVALSGPPALVLFGAGVTLSPAGPGPFEPAEILGLTLALAVLAGYAAIVFLRGEKDAVSIIAILAGTVALTAGAGRLLGGEPMLMAMVAGAVIVNRSTLPHRILRAAHGLDAAVLTALLLLLGAWWRPAPFSWAAFVLLTGVSAGARLAGGALLARAARRRGARVTIPVLGMGLLPQGPLALVLLVAATLLGGLAPGVVEAAFAALAVNTLAGSSWLRRRLFRRPAAPPEVKA